MKKQNRTKNVTKNIIFSMMAQIIILIVNFISRTIFIYKLGSEYLGISGLFTNILTLLSLSELGFGNAIIYSLYKPLSENDQEKISAIMNFYKDVYKIIVVVVAIIGISLIPLLPYIVNVDSVSITNNQIIIYYLLFLLNSLSSYLFAYKSNLISADQKLYILKKYNVITVVIQFVLQMFVLFIFNNYVLYLIMQIICTFGNNIYTARKTQKLYPYLNKKTKLDKQTKKDILNNVKSIFIYKIATVMVENIDSILISIMVGTVAVGFYSNYHMLISAALGIITMFFSSFTASIGNLNTEKDAAKKEVVFRDIIFINSIIMVVSSVCLIFGLNHFIELWIGSDYVLDKATTIVIVFNYYIYGILNPVCVYRDTTGIFREAKNIAIFLATLNLFLSIILGIKFKMLGILLATGISKVLTNVWYQPYILYRDIFKTSSKKYYINQLSNILFIIVMVFLLMPISKFFSEVKILNFIALVLISFIFTMLSYLIFNINNPSLKNNLKRVKQILKK